MSDKVRKDVLTSIPQVQNYQAADVALPNADVNPIETKDLRAEMFPKQGSSFADVVVFAYTFDGYAHYGMEACAALANEALSVYYKQESLPEDISALRACLFFEARRWMLYGSMPDTKANIYIAALIKRLKEKLELS